MDPYNIIYHPFVTEKTMNFMEKNNALEFVVKRNSTKKQIKDAIERKLKTFSKRTSSPS